ncbi:MAG: chemotaxis protein CheA [Psychromonas sp.]|nr:chemotaxis protein CheA [Psychromonas sp.]
MTFEVDDDILQDFLIEAGEIIELLSEQLVELENNPSDTELLNAIFRGFHTVKGGAGFLSLTELVETCHGAENVFDCLRQGQRSVNAALMDTILGALDIINIQFQAVQDGTEAASAPASILAELHRLSKPGSDVMTKDLEEAALKTKPEDVDQTAQANEDGSHTEIVENNNDNESNESNEISDDEFESLLDELHGVGQPNSSDKLPIKNDSNEDVGDDEFESLLDELHGKGAHACADNGNSKIESASSSDEISDDEFESLLDELHGVGKSAQSKDNNEPVTTIGETHKKEQTQSDIEAKVAAKSVINPKDKDSTKQSSVKKPEKTVRVDTLTLDQIMNMVGELVLVRNRLVSLEAESDNEEISKAVANLDIVTGDLQGAVMKTRMQPIKKVFGKFPRIVRDLARSLGKNIRLDVVGEETDLDKNLVEALADPLVHLIRNSLDHGIEMPDVRLQNGKEKEGRVLLSASQEGDHILLCIEDDGAGMDPDQLKNIAIEKGILDIEGARTMSDSDAFSLIFAPGFSTKVDISDISGRGVGMDVVKTGISKLNGSISIDSELGKGTRLKIKVPLTLAILPTLMIVVADQTFAFPLANVNEIFHLDLSKTNMVNNQLTVVIREHVIPLFYLRDWLAPNSPMKDKRTGLGDIVIVQLGTKKIAFVVDALLGQEEVVIKALDSLLTGTPGIAGATITSDGGIALILDLPSLLKHYV